MTQIHGKWIKARLTRISTDLIISMRHHAIHLKGEVYVRMILDDVPLLGDGYERCELFG
jgi:hypothetical protein